MFPEPVHYSRTDSSGWTIYDWDVANKLLSYLEPKRRYFATFSLPDESYVQCLGSKTRLTVEAREYHSDGSFSHWVFGSGTPKNSATKIEVTDNVVTVDETQVLSMRDARKIMRQYLETRSFPTEYYKQDITKMFAT